MIMAKEVLSEESVSQKTREWKNCNKELPTESKHYAVRTINRIYTTDLRTPCIMETRDPSYRWLSHSCTHWCELPDPFYKYGKNASEWHAYMRNARGKSMASNLAPRFAGNEKYFFVTTASGYSTVRAFNNAAQKFNGDDGEIENRVIAWMEMPKCKDDYIVTKRRGES